MDQLEIIKVEILGSGELTVQPASNPSGLFDYIYRAAAEVNWDQAGRRFMSPVPREWSYEDWFKHIVGVVLSETAVTLKITDKTAWVSVTDETRRNMERWLQGEAK